MLPDYRRSVYNVPHTVLRSFGIEDNRALEGLKGLGRDRVILFLVDALGMNVIPRRFLQENYWMEITSVFPSTTSAAITTVFTGLAPKEHGILEWYMFFEGCNDIIKTLLFTTRDSSEVDLLEKRGCNPADLFGLPTVFRHLEKLGKKSSAYLPGEYVNSNYSKYMLDGARVFGYGSLDEIPALLRKDDSDYVYIYTDIVDQVQHEHGTKSGETAKVIDSVLGVAGRITENLKNAALLITADHGQIDIDKRRIVDFGDCPVGGSPRDVFLYCDSDIEEGHAIERKEILGLLGPGNEHPSLQKRLPERVLLPDDGEVVWYREFNVQGMHGGMSEGEMRLPLIVIEK